MANKEIKALTGIRGLLAIRVVLDHYFEYDWVKYIHKHGNHGLLETLGLQILQRGFFSVDFFFFLSAFVLSLVYDRKFGNVLSVGDYRKFMYKRVVRLYPFYLLNVLLFSSLIYKKLTWHRFGINLSFQHSLYDIKMSINPATWSLSVEFMMYLIFPFLFMWVKKLNLKFAIIAIVLFCFGLYWNIETLKPIFPFNYHGIQRVAYQDYLGDGFGLTAVIRGLSGYLLGMLAYRIYKNKPYYDFILRYRNWILGATFILFFVPKASVIIPFFLAMNVIIMTDKNWYSAILESKVVYFFGQLSFSIYLNHLMVRMLFTKFIYEKSLHFDQRMWLFSVEAIFTLMFSFVTYRLFEVPVNAFFRKHILKWKTVKSWNPIHRYSVIRRARSFNRIALQRL